MKARHIQSKQINNNQQEPPWVRLKPTKLLYNLGRVLYHTMQSKGQSKLHTELVQEGCKEIKSGIVPGCNYKTNQVFQVL